MGWMVTNPSNLEKYNEAPIDNNTIVTNKIIPKFLGLLIVIVIYNIYK